MAETIILHLTDGLPYRCDQCMYFVQSDERDAREGFCDRWGQNVMVWATCSVFVREIHEDPET